MLGVLPNCHRSGRQPPISRARVVTGGSVLEKKSFKCFLPYVGMAAILFNDSKPLEKIDNNPLTEGPI